MEEKIGGFMSQQTDGVSIRPETAHDKMNKQTLLPKEGVILGPEISAQPILPPIKPVTRSGLRWARTNL